MVENFALRVVQALMGYVQGLSDDQLKQEDRKSIQELYKLLDSLVHAAKLPQASSAMDRFHLAFALKCLKTPNLEKRLHGLSDIKEMINLNQRKMEYLENMERQDRDARFRQGHAAAIFAAARETSDLIVEWLQRERVRTHPHPPPQPRPPTRASTGR